MPMGDLTQGCGRNLSEAGLDLAGGVCHVWGDGDEMDRVEKFLLALSVVVIAASIAVVWMVHEQDKTCVKWVTDGPPSYVVLNGFAYPVENRHCEERQP